jgi:hypothetical protein
MYVFLGLGVYPNLLGTKALLLLYWFSCFGSGRVVCNTVGYMGASGDNLVLYISNAAKRRNEIIRLSHKSIQNHIYD